MAEANNRSKTSAQYEETRDPKNPPNSLLQPDVRWAVRWSFLAPILMLALIFAFLWGFFYNGQPPHVRSGEETGDRGGVVGTSGHETPGGINPNPTYDRTDDELSFRGVTSSGDANGAQLREKRADQKK